MLCQRMKSQMPYRELESDIVQCISYTVRYTLYDVQCITYSVCHTCITYTDARIKYDKRALWLLYK